MKLKLLVLAGLAAAGVGASIAVADNGHGNDQGDRHGCRAQHVSGTVAPQTFTITVTRGHGSTAPTSTVVVAIGGTGQTVRATVNGCTASGTTTSSTLTVRSVDLKAFPTPPTTTTRKHDDGDHHHGGTTTTTSG